MEVVRSLPRFVGLLTAVALVTGCATGSSSEAVTASKALISDKTLKLSQNVAISLEKLVYWGTYGAVAYMILDPLAPNWEIEEALFPENHYVMSLRMKRIYSGGSGEARQVFLRRTNELVRRGGYDGFLIKEYSESLESSMLGSQRVAYGVVQLQRSGGLSIN